MSKRILTAFVLILLYGCANQSMYSWGPYEETLFAFYHEPAVKEETLKNYLVFIDKGGNPRRPLAPGLYAEAGTFLLDIGDVEGAIRYYELERNTWPESKPMMSVMIENLKEREE